MSAVRLVGIHKAYGGPPVVRGIDLDIPAGARCVLLGPSGCGKTTTLRMVAGLESPDLGSISIGDGVVADVGAGLHLPPERRGLGMVFQTYALWPHLSVHENVAYPLRRARVPDDDVKKRVREALALVHLHGLEGRMPHALSGGQQQRVALARALVARPRVLLMDEPLSNLDARLRDELRVEIASLCQDHGITLLHVTHDQAEALSLGTHVAVMSNGTIAQLGSPQEIYGAPASLDVARFIGDTRVLRASYAEAGRVRVVDAEFEVRVAEVDRPGAACELAVRPDDVQLVDAEHAGAVKGRVLLSSCVGSTHLLDVLTDAGALRVVSPQPEAPGTLVGLFVRHGHAYRAAA